MIALLVLLMTIVPVGLVVIGTFMSLFGYFNVAQVWTLRNWQTALSNATFAHAAANTLLLAGGKAIISMVLFTVIAYVAVRTKFAARGALDLLVWLPSTLPGIILSLGFLWLFLGTPLLRPLYGTTFALILVTALGSITLGTQITKASLLQLGDGLEEASRSVGASWLHTFRFVVVPLVAPTVAVVGVLAFAAGAHATGSVALLSTQSNQPLSMLQLTMIGSNRTGRPRSSAWWRAS